MKLIVNLEGLTKIVSSTSSSSVLFVSVNKAPALNEKGNDAIATDSVMSEASGSHLAGNWLCGTVTLFDG